MRIDKLKLKIAKLVCLALLSAARKRVTSAAY